MDLNAYLLQTQIFCSKDIHATNITAQNYKLYSSHIVRYSSHKNNALNKICRYNGMFMTCTNFLNEFMAEFMKYDFI